MCKSHHYDTFIIHLVKRSRMSLTKIPATGPLQEPQGQSQVTHLDKQVYPGSNGLLTAARAHGYVVIDFNPVMPEKFCLHNTLFPDKDFPGGLPMDLPPSPEKEKSLPGRGPLEGGSPPWDIRTARSVGGFIRHHALAMAAGHCSRRLPPVQRPPSSLSLPTAAAPSLPRLGPSL